MILHPGNIILQIAFGKRISQSHRILRETQIVKQSHAVFNFVACVSDNLDISRSNFLRRGE